MDLETLVQAELILDEGGNTMNRYCAVQKNGKWVVFDKITAAIVSDHYRGAWPRPFTQQEAATEAGYRNSNYLQNLSVHAQPGFYDPTDLAPADPATVTA